MAALFAVLALAVCSASANVCMPILAPKDGCQVSFPEIFSSPSVAVAGSGMVSPVAPRIISGPSFGFQQEFSEPAAEIAASGPFASGSFASGPFASGSFSSGSVRAPQNLPVIQAPPVTLNPVESPIIPLPSPAVPGPQVIRHKCYCTKTVVRPQLIQRTITVPRIQRYLKRTYRPVVENVAYTAKPVGGDSQGQDVVIGGGAAPVSAPVSFVPGGVIGGGVIGGGMIGGGVLSSGMVPAGVISGGPVVEASESTCEQVIPSFARCY